MVPCTPATSIAPVDSPLAMDFCPSALMLVLVSERATVQVRRSIASGEEHHQGRAGEDLKETLLLLFGDHRALDESLGLQEVHKLWDAAVLLKCLV